MSGSDFRALFFWSKYSPQCGFHAYVHDPISLSPAQTTALPTKCLLLNGSLAPQSSISNWATCPVPPYMLLMNSWGLATSSSALRRHRTSGVTLDDCPKFSTYHALPFLWLHRPAPAGLCTALEHSRCSLQGTLSLSWHHDYSAPKKETASLRFFTIKHL